MGLLDFFNNNVTDHAKSKGVRYWKSPKGNEYIKMGGSGRNGLTLLFNDLFKNKK